MGEILTFEEWKEKNPVKISPQVLQSMVENHVVDIDAEIDIILLDYYNQYIESFNGSEDEQVE